MATIAAVVKPPSKIVKKETNWVIDETKPLISDP